MQDPQIQLILTDPIMRQVLVGCSDLNVILIVTLSPILVIQTSAFPRRAAASSING